jgi:hypothetical protein
MGWSGTKAVCTSKSRETKGMGEAIHDDMDGGLLQDKIHASPSMPVLYVSKM